MTEEAAVWHLREKYAEGRLSLAEFEAQVEHVLAGVPLLLEAGELLHIPPGPPVWVRRG